MKRETGNGKREIPKNANGKTQFRYYTVAEAAKIVGMPYSTTTWHLRKMGVEKRGRDYVITDETLADLGRRGERG